jgi:hypothetical protein
MERENDFTGLVELGTATIETQGAIGPREDLVAQLEQAGLSDD